jgi:AcrR family transcriptional regulator
MLKSFCVPHPVTLASTAMTRGDMVDADRALPLRERKKVRTKRALADAALRLFLDKGYDSTTLDELVDEVEVSRRTFFRMYASKDDVALAAELELWDAFAAEVAAREVHGPVLDALRAALADAVTGLGPDWDERFLATRGLLARTPALWDRSIVLSMGAQERVVEQLAEKLGIDARADVRLRLLGELALAAWRCGAKNWIRAGRQTRSPRPENTRGSRLVPGRGPQDARPAAQLGGSAELLRHVEEAFAAIPAAINLTAP